MALKAVKNDRETDRSLDIVCKRLPDQPTWGRLARFSVSPFPASLMHLFFLRIGSLGEIHVASGTDRLPRGRRVIVRTGRGVELGEVVGPIAADRFSSPSVQILRPTTDEDELLIRRLDRHKRRAVEACRDALKQAASPAVLIDVDQLFDGGTLVMHFLGEADAEAETITSKIAAEYEAVVQSRHFAKLLSDGCGPGCGTEEGGGCGTSSNAGSGCSTCSGCGVRDAIATATNA